MDKQERKFIFRTVTFVFVSMLIGTGINIGYTNQVQKQAERRSTQAITLASSRAAEDIRRWCGVIKLIDDRNKDLPPTADPDTMQFRLEWHKLRVEYGC